MAQQPPQKQIRLEIPKDIKVTYANAAIINQTHSEIILDFLQILPNVPGAKMQSRIVLTPANAKSFMQALQKNLENFETKHGEIILPPKPATLADELFNTIRSEDKDDNDDNE